jgi:hypothetical protein
MVTDVGGLSRRDKYRSCRRALSLYDNNAAQMGDLSFLECYLAIYYLPNQNLQATPLSTLPVRWQARSTRYPQSYQHSLSSTPITL